jgi:sulfur-oxidizing protein SoxZ
MASSIKVRTEVEEGITTVRLLIRHPMETGNRKDPAGQSIPAHYIKELLCEHNGKPVLTTYWGPGISRNPYLSFRLAGAKPGDILTICWEDNQGQRDSLETKI